jgi:hypothetical protein
VAALSKAPHPWKPVRSPSDRRPARPHGRAFTVRFAHLLAYRTPHRATVLPGSGDVSLGRQVGRVSLPRYFITWSGHVQACVQG